jgi:hypothetical protein
MVFYQTRQGGQLQVHSEKHCLLMRPYLSLESRLPEAPPEETEAAGNSLGGTAPSDTGPSRICAAQKLGLFLGSGFLEALCVSRVCTVAVGLFQIQLCHEGQSQNKKV